MAVARANIEERNYRGEGSTGSIVPRELAASKTSITDHQDQVFQKWAIADNKFHVTDSTQTFDSERESRVGVSDVLITMRVNLSLKSLADQKSLVDTASSWSHIKILECWILGYTRSRERPDIQYRLTGGKDFVNLQCVFIPLSSSIISVYNNAAPIHSTRPPPPPPTNSRFS